MTKKSLFNAYSPTTNYGIFGYAGQCCDTAINLDNPAMAEECWQRGWMDVETQTFMGTVLDKCDKVAPKVAAKLRELGPILETQAA